MTQLCHTILLIVAERVTANFCSYVFYKKFKSALLDQLIILLSVQAKGFGKIMQAIVPAKQGV